MSSTPLAHPVRTPFRGSPARDLLGDGSLSLRFSPAFADAVGHLVWPTEELAVATGPCTAAIEIENCSTPSAPPPIAEPTLDARFVRFWRNAENDGGLLLDVGGTLEGRIDLRNQHARIRVHAEEVVPEAQRLAVYGALRVSMALLLGRQGRALFHSAALVGSNGRAWLLAGDSHSGKTTTVLTLRRGGFDYVSDDELVLSACPETGELGITGWPRRLALDEGYASGASRGTRAPVDARRFGPGRRRPRAPVAGVIFPRVEAAAPTRLTRVGAADALGRLVRHSPWLLADPPSGAALLGLLRRLAFLPAFDLRLGTDTYANAGALRRHLPPPLGWA